MTTPAQAASIIEGVTRLKHSDDPTYVWILTEDDATSYPFFSSECGQERNRVFCVHDMVIIEHPAQPVVRKTPAQQMGLIVGVSRVQLADKRDRVGDQAGVYILKEDDKTGSPFFHKEGQPDTLECFSLSRIEILPPVPVPVPAPIPAMPPQAPSLEKPLYTALQALAVKTFESMYDDAVAYRAGSDSRLNATYGICDNIDRYASEAGTTDRAMSEVKENLIRQTPSYSGVYHYPVPCPNGGDASSAFSGCSNKWSGDYGLNRLTQLGELVELIKTQWNDTLVNRKTPAWRNGLTVGDLVVYTRTSTPSFWVFRYDDESGSPSFHRLGDPTDYADLDLTFIRKLTPEESKDRTVAEFLDDIKAKVDEAAGIEAQIAELQKSLAAAKVAVAFLDHGLAAQHKVKRI